MSDPTKLVQNPPRGPIEPVRLGLDDVIQFHCRPGIACWNECCRSIDIQLTPYDVLRLSRRLGVPTWQFLAEYAVQFDLDPHGMPGVKLKPVEGGTACRFLREEGCGVYEDRPAACRYYALGAMGLRKMGTSEVEDIYFLVKEPHCLGHREPRRITIREYRREQGVEKYDEMNREWRDIVLKKRSSGPTVGAPSERSFDLFFMASYDLDSFRLFTQSEGFRDMFDLPGAELKRLEEDDEALLAFAMRFLKQVLFGERTIPLRPGARERRLAQRKAQIEARLKAEAERRQAHDPRYDEPDEDEGKGKSD